MAIVYLTILLLFFKNVLTEINLSPSFWYISNDTDDDIYDDNESNESN